MVLERQTTAENTYVPPKEFYKEELPSLYTNDNQVDKSKDILYNKWVEQGKPKIQDYRNIIF